jgi:hypothetical protein
MSFRIASKSILYKHKTYTFIQGERQSNLTENRPASSNASEEFRKADDKSVAVIVVSMRRAQNVQNYEDEKH